VSAVNLICGIGFGSDATRHHLAPFAVPGEPLGLLERLAARGALLPQFELLLRTVREGAPVSQGDR
jgi:hypothetical protein